MSSSSPPRHNLVKRRRRDSSHYLSPLNSNDFSEIPRHSLALPFLSPELDFAAASCGGLLYFDDGAENILICNPTTKQFRSFPLLDKSAALAGGALGYDAESGDYKIVRISKNKHEAYAEVYSLGNDDGWWEIDNGPPIRRRSKNIYIAATGRSYWLAADGRRVVSFDFTGEAFSSFGLPGCKIDYSLVELGGGVLGAVGYGRRGSGRDFGRLGRPGPDYYYELWAWAGPEKGGWRRMFDLCACGGVGGPLGLIEGRYLCLNGISESHGVLVYDWAIGKCVTVGVDEDWATRVVSYVQTDFALPRGKSFDGDSGATACCKGKYMEEEEVEEVDDDDDEYCENEKYAYGYGAANRSRVGEGDNAAKVKCMYEFGEKLWIPE